MGWTRVSAGVVLGAVLALPIATRAQQSFEFDLSAFDPAAAALLAKDVVQRAPDADIDRVFHAVHAASRSDSDAAVMCALFSPDADRSPAALQRAAQRLGPDTRQRFLDALAVVAMSGLQQPRQPYDRAAAEQVLKSAGAKAMFLNEGFVEGMAMDGNDDESQRLRCRSLRWMVDALATFEPAQRASATRFLLLEGVALSQRAF